MEQPSVLLVVDLGGAGTKFIYSKPGGKVASGYIEASTISITPESAASLQQLTAVEPENACWVGRNGQYVAIGYLASTFFAGNARIKESKVASATAKALGALWVIRERLGLPQQFVASFASLLPPGELIDKDKFRAALLQSASKFETPSGTLNVAISDFTCLPEGAGCYLLRAAKGREDFKRKVVAFIMLGYRNASVLVSRRGLLDVAGTGELGMHRLVSLVSLRCSNLEAVMLATPIAQAGWEINEQPLERLVRSRSADPDARVHLVEAIRRSQLEYFNALFSWLFNTIPKEADELVFCGGTADYLKPKLFEAFTGYELSMHANVKIPRLLDTWGLGNRLCDAYGLYLHLEEDFSKRTYADKVEGKRG